MMLLSACSQVDDMTACMHRSQVMPEGVRSSLGLHKASKRTVKLVTLAAEQTLTAACGFGLMHNQCRGFTTRA